MNVSSTSLFSGKSIGAVVWTEPFQLDLRPIIAQACSALLAFQAVPPLAHIVCQLSDVHSTGKGMRSCVSCAFAGKPVAAVKSMKKIRNVCLMLF